MSQSLELSAINYYNSLISAHHCATQEVQLIGGDESLNNIDVFTLFTEVFSLKLLRPRYFVFD